MNTQFIDNVFVGLFADRETSIARDLKMNLKRLAEDSQLDPADYALILLSLSVLRKNDPFRDAALALARENAAEVLTAPNHVKGTDATTANGATDNATTDDIIREATEVPAIMTMLNSYYKFRRFLRDADPTTDDTYGAAKLRMQSLAQPKMGHERFEILALAVSIANSCEQCVTSHVEALKKLGVSTEKIHDVARLTSAVLGALSL